MTGQTRSEVIVLGASMAGLLTARVLSHHFDRVTLIERDAVSAEPLSRKGQPQTRHLHGLLASGMQIMTDYYPDLPAALREGGAILNDMLDGMRWYCYGGYRKGEALGMPAALMSRPFLEALIRERTLKRPNIVLRDNCAVRALLTDERMTRVTGIEAEQRDAKGGIVTLRADLVVDCTGRGSRTPHWLTELGYAPPPESEVKINVGYATRVYRRDPADPRGSQWVLITPDAPRESRFGGMFPQEGDRWIVSVGGWLGDHAPTDEAGFNAFVRSLPAADIYDVISQAEPLGAIVPHKFNASLRRHYEKLTRFPHGLLVLGDAIASFNPTYGQGMTSAAMQAQALDRLLTQRQGALDGLAQPYFKQIAVIVDRPWQLAVGEDFRFPQTTGPKPPGVDLINRYVTLVHRATLSDPVVTHAFARVMNLLDAPPSLMRPAILWRVLRANFSRRRDTPQPAVPVQAQPV